MNVADPAEPEAGEASPGSVAVPIALPHNPDNPDEHDCGEVHYSPRGAAAAVRNEPRLRQQRPPSFPTLEESPGLTFKVVDLGNACWRDRHFTSDIQTRQYRCPEVILNSDYDTSADMWSVSCVLFEAATGDMLFSPKAGQTWSRDEDHLALIMELVGKLPRKLALAGKYSKQFFTQKGDLRNIRDLRFWPLRDVLLQKYEVDEAAAAPFADFMLPMLDLDPARRATAAEMLQHEWLKEDPQLVDRLTRESLHTPPAPPASRPAAATAAATKAAPPSPASAGPEAVAVKAAAKAVAEAAVAAFDADEAAAPTLTKTRSAVPSASGLVELKVDTPYGRIVAFYFY